MSIEFRVKRCGGCGSDRLHIVSLPQVVRHRPDIGALVFGDVPAQECLDCGERFFPSEVAMAMDKVIRERVAATRTLELPFFPMRELATT